MIAGKFGGPSPLHAVQVCVLKFTFLVNLKRFFLQGLILDLGYKFALVAFLQVLELVVHLNHARQMSSGAVAPAPAGPTPSGAPVTPPSVSKGVSVRAKKVQAH